MTLVPRVTRAKRAWLAGLLEGEGTFAVAVSAPGRRPTLRIKLEMTDEDVVRRALAVAPNATGHVGTSRRLSRSGTEYKATYVLNWAGKHAEAVMRTVLPFMGERRASVIESCLATPNLSHYPKAKTHD